MLFVLAVRDTIVFSKLLKTDMLAWMFAIMVVLLTILAAIRQNRRLLFVAFLVSMLAVTAKYIMLPVVVLPGLAAILLLPRTRAQRIAVIAAVAVIIGAGVFLLTHPPEILRTFLMSFPARELYQRDRVFQFVSLNQNWTGFVDQVGMIQFVVVLVGLPAGLLVWKQATRLTPRQIQLLLAVALTGAINLLLLSLFSQSQRDHYRYLVVMCFALIWGVAIAAAARRDVRFAIPLALILVAPGIVSNWNAGTAERRPDTRILTVDWFLANTPEGTRIALEKDHVEFNPSYGGYPGDKTFFVEEVDSVYDESVEGYTRRGVEYLVADYRSINRGGFFELGRDNKEFRSQVETVLELVKPWNRGWQGPERYIFRLPPPMQNPMHVFLGDGIVFKGYDLSQREVAPGDTVDLVLYWLGLRPTDANYIVFAHLTGEDAKLAAQLDGPPGDALHRTYDWNPGYFGWDEWLVPLPEDAAPGTYTLTIGMYDADTLVRLPMTDADGQPLGDELSLGEITVRP